MQQLNEELITQFCSNKIDLLNAEKIILKKFMQENGAF